MKTVISQSRAAIGALWPSCQGLPPGPVRIAAALWIWTLYSCGIPGPAATVEDIDRIPRMRLPSDGAQQPALSYLANGDKHSRQIIFVHGTPGSAENWADYLLDVPEGMEYIALDRLGFGQSGPEGSVVSLAEQAAAVKRLLETRNGCKPILVGHSLGGPIVAWVAAENPEAVGGIIIAAGSLDPGQERIHPLQHLGEMWPVRPLLPRAIRNSNQELMELKLWLEQLQSMLNKICTRVLIIHGTEDDLVPYENVDFIRQHLTGAAQVTVDRLEGANHFLPWNSKVRIEAAIQTLAQDCDGEC